MYYTIDSAHNITILETKDDTNAVEIPSNCDVAHVRKMLNLLWRVIVVKGTKEVKPFTNGYSDAYVCALADALIFKGYHLEAKEVNGLYKPVVNK